MFHYSDYLREQAVKYRELAEKAEDPSSSKSSSNWRRFVRRSRIISTTDVQADSQHRERMNVLQCVNPWWRSDEMGH